MLVALAMVTTACSRSDQRATATPRTAFAPTIEAAPPVVEQMLQRVAAIRGLAPPASLKVGLVARSQVPALLDSLTTEADQRIMSQTTTLYRLLGHLQPDQDYQTIYDGFVAQALVGLYSPKRQSAVGGAPGRPGNRLQPPQHLGNAGAGT